MLKKLLKYEFMATGRTFGLCYLALLALSLLLGLSMGWLPRWKGASSSLLVSLLGVGYVCMLVAVMVITFATILQRFYKNLLGGEGYLMNTLPVRATQLVASKLIAALVWCVSGGAVIALSAALLTLTAGGLSGLLDRYLLHRLLRLLPIHLPALSESLLYLAEGLLHGLVSTAASICLVYLCCLLGHLLPRWRVAGGILFYLLINSATASLYTLTWRIPEALAPAGAHFTWYADALSVTGLVFNLILTAGFFLLCARLLEKHLDLD